jgi:hypothetical protein
MPHDPGQPCFQHLTHLTRAIIAGVVHDDELKGPLGIRDDCVHSVRKKSPSIFRRDHDAEAFVELAVSSLYPVPRKPNPIARARKDIVLR